MTIKSFESLKNNQVFFYDISAFPQLWTDKKFSMNNIPREQNGLFICVEGEIEYKTDDCVLKVKSGDVIYLPKGSKYTVYFGTDASPVTSYLINFSMKDNDGELIFDDKPQKLLSTADYLTKSFKQIAFVFSSANNCSFEIQSHLYRLFNKILSQKYTIQNETFPDAITKAVALLEDYRNLSISEIADKCAVSETYLRKSFKKYLNISPNEYRIKTRIEKAKNLLLNSEMSVKEITYLLGFYDEAYFYKIFKAETGLTPKQYKTEN